MGRHSSPFAYFLLVFPSGISSGFLSVTLPFVLTQAGVPVASATAIVAIGSSSMVWRFLWAPVVDLSWSSHTWYLAGLVFSAVTLCALAWLPPVPGTLLTSVAFLSQVAMTVNLLPVSGMIAHTVGEHAKGRASGWYQAGNLGGLGIGGGLGVWLASRYGHAMAGAVLAAMMMLCGAAVALVPNVRAHGTARIVERWRAFGRDFLEMVKSPLAILVIVLVSSPLGAGVAPWSAVADDWHASPQMVALVTGVLAGVASAAGSLLGGRICDRFGRFWGFFGGGVALALVAIGMALLPKTSMVYGSGVLLYAAMTGVAYSTYTAVLFLAIGKGAASAKYAIVGSFGNIPVVYMTASDGWAHDRWGASGMLYWEGLLGLAAVALGLIGLWGVRARQRQKLAVRGPG